MGIIRMFFATLALIAACVSTHAADIDCATRHNDAERLACAAQARSLPTNATSQGIAQLSEITRQRFAKNRGLPDTATWDEITLFDSEALRRQGARERGLPNTATWEEIDHFDSEAPRRQEAKKRGLPLTTSWDEITHFDSEASRRQEAKKRGLPLTATWEEITRHTLK